MSTCLTDVTEIDKTDCIGATRTIINDNFSHIKDFLCSLDDANAGIEDQLLYVLPYGAIINIWSDITLGGASFDLSGRGKINQLTGQDLTGFALCNGGNGTPDLRDRFVVSTGNGYNQGEYGPLYNSTLSLTYSAVRLTIPELPIHTHVVDDPQHNHKIIDNPHQHSYKDKYNKKGDTGVGNSLFGWFPIPGFIAPTKSFVKPVKNDGAGGHNPTGDTFQKSTSDSSSFITVEDASSNIDILNTGGNQVHENRPPFFALAYIMRVEL